MLIITNPGGLLTYWSPMSEAIELNWGPRNLSNFLNISKVNGLLPKIKIQN